MKVSIETKYSEDGKSIFADKHLLFIAPHHSAIYYKISKHYIIVRYVHNDSEKSYIFDRKTYIKLAISTDEIHVDKEDKTKFHITGRIVILDSVKVALKPEILSLGNISNDDISLKDVLYKYGVQHDNGLVPPVYKGANTYG